MIHFFNRHEVVNTTDVAQKARACEILEQNNIDYYTKVVRRFGVHDARFGYTSVGVNMNSLFRYIVYVKNTDAEKAAYLINKR